MGDLPLDAEQIVRQLRQVRQEAGVAPSSWTPSASFERLLEEESRPVHGNEHLAWMHRNWDVRTVSPEEPSGRGLAGTAKRLLYRTVRAVVAPYIDRIADYLGTNARAVDLLSRRLDDVTAAQRRTLEALRRDLIDFANHIDERLGQLDG